MEPLDMWVEGGRSLPGVFRLPQQPGTECSAVVSRWHLVLRLWCDELLQRWQGSPGSERERHFRLIAEELDKKAG